MASITTGEGKGFEHARGALTEDRSPVTTSLVAKSAGDPAFAQSGGPGYQQVLMTRGPTTGNKMRYAVIERKEGRLVRLEKLLADFKRALFGH